MNTPQKPQPTHWYKYFVGECPVCGKDKSYKVRMYGPKPEARKERYQCLPASETYDHCDTYVY